VKNKKLFAILTLVCFMFTLMPVAAFAAIDMEAADNSYIYAEDSEVDVNENVELTISAVAEVTTVWVWFEKTNNTPNTALVGTFDEDGNAVDSATEGIVAVDVTAGKGTTYVQFDKDGEYELHASLVAPIKAEGKTWAESIAAIADYEVETQDGYDTVVVNADAAKTSKYVIKLDGETTPIKDNGKGSVAMGSKEANGIDEVDVKFTVYKSYTAAVVDNPNTVEDETAPEVWGDVVYAKDIEIDTTSGLDVNDLKVKRDGTVDFDVTVNKAGMHKIYVTIDDFNATLTINAQDGEAEDITVDYVSKTPVNIKEAQASLESYLRFIITDVNGNELDDTDDGIDNAQDPASNYVTLTDKPADSKLKSGNLALVYSADKEAWTVQTNKAFDEEGTYSFKVALDNGNYAKASLTFKEAGDPVSLVITYETDNVQLGGTITPKAISRMDANYVTSTVGTAVMFNSDVEFAVSGAAVEKVENNTIYVKDNEKYVGSTIKVTVVDKEYDLVATKTLTVSAEANELVFDTTAVPVDATTNVKVTLVDENGKAVGLDATTAEAFAIVLDKPANADADATAGTVDKKTGTFKVAFSADTVGTYTVQAVLTATVDNVVRYYTGVQEIKVGATGIEDTVVMSIGASKIVVNDEVVAIDAAPMIKDSRTFVPFRALAEAFGAVVEFDAATQAVVAELDGIKVVMTIGSEVYTVNGVAKTADVAPFISDSRTMVPVRFAAEAFGITVTPIYAEDGTVADVLFTK